MQIHAPNRMDTLKPGKKASLRDVELTRKAEEFEAVFLSQMLTPMFEGLETPEMFGGGSYAEDVYKSMMVDEYGKLLAKTGGIGLADHIRRELLTLQEVR